MFDSFEKFWAKFSSVAGWNNFNISQVYLFVGITLAGFLIEMIFTGWKNSSLHKLLSPGRSERTDIVMWLVNLFSLGRILGVLFTFGLCYYLAGQIGKALHLNLMVHITNPILQFILLLFISDLKNYSRHYFYHHFSPMWMAHKFHHSADEFTMITHHRNHFLENAVGMFFDVIPFVILGASPQSFFLIQALLDLHQMLIHGRWQSDWGFVGRYIIVSPVAHRIHHSASAEHYGKNFGSLFIFWDRIFRTYQPATEVTIIGLPEDNYNKHGFLSDYWRSYADAFKHLYASMRKKLHAANK